MSSRIMPDYKNCILNTTASLLKHYNVPVSYPGLDVLDAYLSKDYKNVILMIFDGIGVDMLRKNLPGNSFLRRNMVSEIKSVFPCTTTAAMTSYYSGLSPNEHGWLGWSLYFKEYGRVIDTFTNQDSFTKENAGEKHAAYTIMPYETVYEKIHKATAGKIKTYTIMPSEIMFPEYPNVNIKAGNVNQICRTVKSLCTGNDKKFIMSYWYEPDKTMHSYGCYVEQTKAQIDIINRQIEELCNDLKDTIVIISADHGLINIEKEIYLNDIPEIDECLIMPPSIESRAASLFIKPEMKVVFKEQFEKLFGSSFELYSKEEVLQNRFLGYGIQHKKVTDFIGDYVACATGNVMIRYNTLNGVKKHKYEGQHAGLTAEEMLVPLIII